MVVKLNDYDKNQEKFAYESCSRKDVEFSSRE